MQPVSHTIDTEPANTAARKRWMGILARAATEQLRQALVGLEPRPEYEHLRPPEVGMALVRGRAGGDGDRFNLGEMTLTRCSVKTADGRIGHGYVAGRDKRHAELAAVFDALLQCPERGGNVMQRVIEPLGREQSERRAEQAAKTAATRVNFFTMARGEDER